MASIKELQSVDKEKIQSKNAQGEIQFVAVYTYNTDGEEKISFQKIELGVQYIY